VAHGRDSGEGEKRRIENRRGPGMREGTPRLKREMGGGEELKVRNTRGWEGGKGRGTRIANCTGVNWEKG